MPRILLIAATVSVAAVVLMFAADAHGSGYNCNVGVASYGGYASNAYAANYYAKPAAVNVDVLAYPYLVPAVATVYTPSYPEISESSATAAALRAEARALEAQARAAENAIASAASKPLAVSHGYATVQTFVPAAVKVQNVGYGGRVQGFSNYGGRVQNFGVRNFRQQNQQQHQHANGVNVNVNSGRFGSGANVSVQANGSRGHDHGNDVNVNVNQNRGLFGFGRSATVQVQSNGQTTTIRNRPSLLGGRVTTIRSR